MLPDINNIESISIDYYNMEANIVARTDSAIECIYDSLSSARVVKTEREIPDGGQSFTINILDNNGSRLTLGYFQCFSNGGFMFLANQKYEVSNCDMKFVWEVIGNMELQLVD